MRHSTPATILVALATLLAHAAAGGTGSAAVTVGATVRPVAVIESRSAGPVVTITADDVARGWVDAPDPLEVRVRTNAPGGYELELRTGAATVWLTEVTGLGETTLYGSGKLRVRRRPAGIRETLALRFRFHLREGTEPGVHPWPVAMDVRPR